MAPADPAAPTDPVAAIFGAYVASQAFVGREPLCLRVGARGSAGQRDPGWVVIDSLGQPNILHDVTYGLPFADGTVASLDLLDVVEPVGECATLLVAEARRVLRPGGEARITTPDLDVALERRRTLAAQGILLQGASGRVPTHSAATLGDLLRPAGLTVVDVASAAGGLQATATA